MYLLGTVEDPDDAICTNSFLFYVSQFSVSMTEFLRKKNHSKERVALACGFEASMYSDLVLWFVGCNKAEHHGGRSLW